MPGSDVNVNLGRPEWLEDFKAWVARQSPATIVDLIDVLALELRERDAGEHPALAQGSDLMLARQLVRVDQLVDDFLLAPARPASARSLSETLPGL